MTCTTAPPLAGLLRGLHLQLSQGPSRAVHISAPPRRQKPAKEVLRCAGER